MKQMLKNASGDETGDATSYFGGLAYLIMTGEFNGGRVTPQIKAPDGSWVDLIKSAMTEPGAQVLDAPRADLRLQCESVGSVSAWIR